MGYVDSDGALIGWVRHWGAIHDSNPAYTGHVISLPGTPAATVKPSDVLAELFPGLPHPAQAEAERG